MNNFKINTSEKIRNGKKGIVTLLRGFVILTLLASINACNTTSSESTFALETYLGNYSGPVKATFEIPGQSPQAQDHQGQVQISDLSGGQARMNLIFEGNSILTFEGSYDENGWTMTSPNSSGFTLSVDPEGNIAGGLNRQDISFSVGGKMDGQKVRINVVQEYLQATSNFSVGTKLGFDFNVQR